MEHTRVLKTIHCQVGKKNSNYKRIHETQERSPSSRLLLVGSSSNGARSFAHPPL